MRRRSTRRLKARLILASMCIAPVMLIIGALLHMQAVTDIGFILLITQTIVIVALAIACKRTGCSFQVLCRNLSIVLSLDNALISIGAYEDTGSRYVPTPSINVLPDVIKIGFCGNPTFRKVLERYKDELSTALPAGIVVQGIQIPPSQEYLLIYFDDLVLTSQKAYESIEQLNTEVRHTLKSEIIIDAKHIIDLQKTPGMLITGVTGSGKTYATRYYIMQMLMKGAEVSVLDVKRTYQSLDHYVVYKSTCSEIIDELQRINECIDTRSKEMDEYLRTDPDAVATDYGYPLCFVVVEEYLALMSIASAAEKKQINALVMKIATMGRQLSVHLVIVMQVSGADQLDSAVRSNLPVKLVFGTGTETIYRTAFGQSDVPKIPFKLERGEGIGQTDNTRFMFHTPKILFPLSDLTKVMSTKEAGRH